MFIKLSKYASSLVWNPMDKMIHSVMGVFNYLLEECRAVMFHNNMDIYRLIIYVQQHMFKVWQKTYGSMSNLYS